MAHRRVIDCSWDEDTKLASVTLSSKWGKFTGYAKPHDEDVDVANRWSGWRIAEYKCRVKIMKKRAEAMRERYYGLVHYEDQLWHSFSYSDALRYAKRDWYKSREEYRNLKNNFREFCKDEVDSRRQFLKDVENKRM